MLDAPREGFSRILSVMVVMKPNWKSLLFVFLQFLCLAVISLTGPLLAAPLFLAMMEILGLVIGIWAVFAMRIGFFNIAPEPLSWSVMVSRGPYQVIRHPMYLALLVTTLPLVISNFNMMRLVVWLVLLITLMLKMNHEESLLQQRFPEYVQYQKQTAKLVPGFY
jgi:protein-S-isoprenylcysteine O-methyltransferase Ste14